MSQLRIRAILRKWSIIVRIECIVNPNFSKDCLEGFRTLAIMTELGKLMYILRILNWASYFYL